METSRNGWVGVGETASAFLNIRNGPRMSAFSFSFSTQVPAAPRQKTKKGASPNVKTKRSEEEEPGEEEDTQEQYRSLSTRTLLFYVDLNEVVPPPPPSLASADLLK